VIERSDVGFFEKAAQHDPSKALMAAWGHLSRGYFWIGEAPLPPAVREQMRADLAVMINRLQEYEKHSS
jgi:hypothetical protein